MGRGTVEAQTLRSEQFEFEARTSDPADAQPGEYWIRTDQTSTNPDTIAELRRQDNSGVTAAPIFSASEESNLGTDVVRGPSVVFDDGSVGFVAMTTGGGIGSPRAVNSSGTAYESHDALELSTTPDTSMLQSPIRQFYAGLYDGSDGDSPVGFPDAIGSDATAVNSPTFNTEFSNSGYATIDYNPTNTDYHTWSGSGSLPTGSSATVSIIALFYTNTDTSNQIVSGYSDFYISLRSDGAFGVDSNNNPTLSGDTYQTNTLTTAMITHDASGSETKLYTQGSSSPDTTKSSATYSLDDSQNAHGYQLSRNGFLLDGGIVEIIYSDVIESGSDYASWHTNRLG